jgi:Fe-S cluster assembly ATP-binding protein
MLNVKNVTVHIGDKQILKKMNVTFEKGKIYAIMGPNGSGKSTLASTVMGHPLYETDASSEILFKGKDITDLKPDERARMGIFMSFQSPLSLSGVNIYQLLRFALDKKMDPLTIRKKVNEYAKKLKVKEELLTRSLNDGFSGGEKKKMEVITAALLNPDVLFFDEIDTGVDVDALKAISMFLKEFHTKDKTYVLITHYQRILKYLRPDKVLVIIDGELVAEGDEDLVKKIEEDGYESLRNKK